MNPNTRMAQDGHAGIRRDAAVQLPNPRSERFAKWLKDAIEETGITYTRLAERAGVSSETIRRFLAGLGNPKEATVRDIARALKKPEEEALVSAGFYVEAGYDLEVLIREGSSIQPTPDPDQQPATKADIDKIMQMLARLMEGDSEEGV